ncbi:Protein translocase subunit SecA [Melia azedarach]|uniref:Protein translocase subunit SecA n=1 Tax=Melia azedarach TaxID=155640 RepID=A0ACC1WQR4_MELAZ|nr:Protein translocase subunit SecA [Melia azedarach]
MVYGERTVLVKTLDCLWRDHLINMNQLSSAVNVRSFGHRNPLEEYKIDGCQIFHLNAQCDQEANHRITGANGVPRTIFIIIGVCHHLEVEIIFLQQYTSEIAPWQNNWG